MARKISLPSNMVSRIIVQKVLLMVIDLLAILKKNLNRTTFIYILKNFRMCIIEIEALTPLDRTSRINIHKTITRSRLFCRIAKIFIAALQEIADNPGQNKMGHTEKLHFPFPLICLCEGQKAFKSSNTETATARKSNTEVVKLCDLSQVF